MPLNALTVLSDLHGLCENYRVAHGYDWAAASEVYDTADGDRTLVYCYCREGEVEFTLGVMEHKPSAEVTVSTYKEAVEILSALLTAIHTEEAYVVQGG